MAWDYVRKHACFVGQGKKKSSLASNLCVSYAPHSTLWLEKFIFNIVSTDWSVHGTILPEMVLLRLYFLREHKAIYVDGVLQEGE